jgi:hypothetical protein
MEDISYKKQLLDYQLMGRRRRTWPLNRLLNGYNRKPKQVISRPNFVIRRLGRLIAEICIEFQILIPFESALKARRTNGQTTCELLGINFSNCLFLRMQPFLAFVHRF